MSCLTKYSSLLFDMDGVLRIKNKAIPQAKSIIPSLKKYNLKIGIVTNECRYTHTTLKEDLKNMGIKEIQNIPICTPNDVICNFLQKRLNNTKYTIQVGIFGEEGLFKTLCNITHPNYKFQKYPNIDCNTSSFKKNTEYYAIVGASNGYSNEEIKRASRWFSMPNCKIITTCNDESTMGEVEHMPRDLLKKCNIPVERSYCFGKPNSLYFQYALNKLDVKNNNTLFIGDSMDTDIRGSFENNITNCLVLTGNTKNTENIKKSLIYQPNYIIRTLDNLPNILEY